MNEKLAKTGGKYPILRCPTCGNETISIIKTIQKSYSSLSFEHVGQLIIETDPKPQPEWLFIIACVECGKMVLVPSDRDQDFKSYSDFVEFMVWAEKHVGFRN